MTSWIVTGPERRRVAASTVLGLGLVVTSLVPMSFYTGFPDWVLEAFGGAAFVLGPVGAGLGAASLAASRGRRGELLAALVPVGLAIGGWLDTRQADGLAALRGGLIGVLAAALSVVVAYWILRRAATLEDRQTRRVGWGAGAAVVTGALAGFPLGMGLGEDPARLSVTLGFALAALSVAGLAFADAHVRRSPHSAETSTTVDG